MLLQASVEQSLSRKLLEAVSLFEATGDELSFVANVEAHVVVAFSNGDHEGIEQASRLLCGQRPGFIVRRTIESMAERVDVVRPGRRGTFGLFAVPLLICMEHETPESHVDSVAAQALKSLDLLGDLLHRHDATMATVVPRFYRFTDLNANTLHLMRRHTLKLAREEDASLARVQALFSTPPASKRRSSVFLRYLVGVMEHPFGTRPPGKPERWELLEESLSDLLSTRLRTGVEVSTRFDSTFYDSLYHGMSQYQSARLQRIAQTTLAIAPDVEALVHVPEPLAENRIRVGLRAIAHGPELDAYLLNFRPGELPACAFRAADESLRNGGVKVVTQLTSQQFRTSASHWRSALPI